MSTNSTQFYSGLVFPAHHRPQLSPPVSGRCNPHRCLCSPLASRRMRAASTALVLSPQILVDLGPRAPLALLVLACRPSPSPRTRLHWYMHSPLQVLLVVMHSCASRSSLRAGTNALDLAPLAPCASRHPPYRSQSRSHTLYFCPLVCTIHPSDPSAR
jgi:hypothetical protein